MTRHVRDVIASGQVRAVGKLPATQSMRLTLVLPLRNQSNLDQFLKDLYDPSSAYFHQFLTVDEFTSLFGPSKEDYAALIQFAKSNGFNVVGTSRNRVNLDVSGSVAAIEKAFHVNMGVYQHPTENRTFFGPDREPTPSVSVRLWRIAGLDNYSIPHPAGLHKRVHEKPNATTGSGPSASFLGSDMRAAYYGGSALTGSGQSLGLLEYVGTDLADLTTYYSNVHQTNTVPVTLLSTDGTSTSCVAPGCDDTEQTLDMTQALGMAPGLSSLVVYVGSGDAAIFNAMATRTPLNAQLSSSWTWSPADPNTDNPYFQEFAAQGQNLFQASGDSGAWTSRSAIYPADDAFLTSVGGTDLVTSSAGGPWSSETVWVDGGGGISPDRYTIPSWQTTAAAGCSSCSKTLRNGPDVSANANFTFYVCANQTTCTANTYGGTSFAAPMWAGYLALVNQQSVANGGKPLGFINPLIYAIAAGSSYTTDFHDITSGSNGFSATAGYDLATGLGSPNGAALINALAPSSTSPDFSMSASPSSVTIVQGGAGGTSTITITPTNGFSGSVTLSASGLPSGVTATFGTNPATSSSVLTLTASASATTGTASITISGVSGTLNHSTTVQLTVNPSASFTLSAAPSSVTITQGGAGGTSTITVHDLGGFNGSVTLSASGLPSGVTAAFGTNPTTSTSILTLTAGATATTGTATVTISGASGSLHASTTIQLTVNPAALGNFTLSASPTSLSIRRGSQGSSTITIHPSGGFTGAVTLSATGMRSGTTASFSTNPATSTSVVTFTASSSATTGTVTITIHGTSGSLSHTTTLSLRVHR
jgi:subtilase family serine protease